MIDVHVHVVPPRLPGAGSLGRVLDAPPQRVAQVLRREMVAAGIDQIFAMGHLPAADDDPLGIESTLRVAEHLQGLFVIGVADPRRDDADHLRRVERVIASGRVRALKGYLGYLHFGPDHVNYRPYYELAGRYRIPFVFHTGDTFSPYAKLKYAHPLGVDEVAVDHPETRFVIAHFGNPWMTDAAEVVYKNMNVWADLSGFVVGDADAFTEPSRRDHLGDLRTNLQRAFRYCERPNRVVFGTDWPLAPLKPYREFVARCLPAEYHDAIFRDNAAMLMRAA